MILNFAELPGTAASGQFGRCEPNGDLINAPLVDIVGWSRRGYAPGAYAALSSGADVATRGGGLIPTGEFFDVQEPAAELEGLGCRC